MLPEVAGAVGVSKSAVSRRCIEATAAQLAALNEGSLKDAELLVIYIDGIIMAGHHVLAAVGVDRKDDKRLLGLSADSSENAQVVKDLLTGAHAHVQRCRTHKLRNVLERLPKEIKAQTKSVMNAAYKLDAKLGMQKIRQQAKWLQAEHADAAASLLEGLEEMLRRLQEMLEQEKKVTGSKSLAIDKSRVKLATLVAALFYDLSQQKQVRIPGDEKRGRDLRELVRKNKRPVALFVDEAHDLNGHTLTGLKRLVEVIEAGQVRPGTPVGSRTTQCA